MAGKQEDGGFFAEREAPVVKPLTKRGSNSASALRGFVERLETLNEEAAQVAESKRDLMMEAKAAGFSPPAIRRVVALRKLEAEQRETLKMYADATGVFE